MKYVLDASVAAYWVLRNPLQAKALKLRAKHQQNIHELIAPAHFQGEIASALTKAERQKLIPVGDARKLIADVLSTPPILYPPDPLFYRAVDISSQTGRGEENSRGDPPKARAPQHRRICHSRTP